MLLPLEVEEIGIQVILEGSVYPSEVEEARLLVKEAEGVVEHFLTLLEVATAHHLREGVAVGVLWIDLWM